MMAREHKLSIKFYLFSCAMNCSLLFANLTSNFLTIEVYQSSYQYYNTQHVELVLNHHLSGTSITLTGSIKKLKFPRILHAWMQCALLCYVYLWPLNVGCYREYLK
jgi:hypothetical protein